MPPPIKPGNLSLTVSDRWSHPQETILATSRSDISFQHRNRPQIVDCYLVATIIEMAQDPYTVLGLAHSANALEIRRAYRNLAMRLHPDRLMRRAASEEEIKASTANFAAVTSAYSLLSDPARKRQYDHIYKFGGYQSSADHRRSPQPRPPTYSSSPGAKKMQRGIGYKFTNPMDYLLSQGKVKSTTVAGVAIPSRFAFGDTKAFQVSISTGKAEESPSGSLHCRSTTTLFTEGKKHNRVETTYIDRQGRKETIIQSDDYIERRVGQTKPRRRRHALESVKENDEAHAPMMNQKDGNLPWHKQVANVYKDISSNIQRCTNPAAINLRGCQSIGICGTGMENY
jgi:curved DNA-binding protein CbpA